MIRTLTLKPPYQYKMKKDADGYTEAELLEMLQNNRSEAIDLLFRRHYRFVCQAAYRVLPDGHLIEDLAQDVFYELWKKREKLNITTSVRAYLKRAVINKTLNYIRSQRMKFSDVEDHSHEMGMPATALIDLQNEELTAVLHKAIDDLPERCRIVFTLSRFEEYSYQQIATELEISTKTVENQISKALKLLRIALAKYRER